VEEAVSRLRSAGAIYSSLDSVWKAIVKADVSAMCSACESLGDTMASILKIHVRMHAELREP